MVRSHVVFSWRENFVPKEMVCYLCLEPPCSRTGGLHEAADDTQGRNPADICCTQTGLRHWSLEFKPSFGQALLNLHDKE
jgi:hypothetical protein